MPKQRTARTRRGCQVAPPLETGLQGHGARRDPPVFMRAGDSVEVEARALAMDVEPMEEGMGHRKMHLWLSLVGLCAATLVGAAEKRYGPGVTDTEIRIGQTV